jgi:tetratricopeptide (TPR) repeat protein
MAIKKNIKISKEELETDEVLEFADHLLIFLRLHGNKILTVICVVFLVYASVIFFRNRQENVLRSASDKLYALTLDYEKAMADHEWGTPGRQDAMKDVISQADTIIKEFGSTAVARNALLMKANAYFYAGDGIGSVSNTQEAIKYFTEYAERAQKEGDEFERAGALLALGYAQENLSILTSQSNPQGSQQSLVAAMDFYDQITKLTGAGFLKYEAMNAKARILSDRGNKDDAKALYMQVVKENYKPTPDLPEDASQRDREVNSIKQMNEFFTTGSSARQALSRLGVDLLKLDEELKAASGKDATPAAK